MELNQQLQKKNTFSSVLNTACDAFWRKSLFSKCQLSRDHNAFLLVCVSGRVWFVKLKGCRTFPVFPKGFSETMAGGPRTLEGGSGHAKMTRTIKNSC